MDVSVGWVEGKKPKIVVNTENVDLQWIIRVDRDTETQRPKCYRCEDVLGFTRILVISVFFIDLKVILSMQFLIRFHSTQQKHPSKNTYGLMLNSGYK